MSTGLIALLDDIAGIAKVAAASLDDATAQATKAGVKAAGVVIDDAAVTPRYVMGFSASRELPIVWRIAVGSLKNKLVFLLPGALLLSAFAEWAIIPLLMIGGAFLCYEGAEKVYEALFPHEAHEHEAAVARTLAEAESLEEQKVQSAIKTDFILSAEIMAIALAELPAESVWEQALVLAIVGVGITALVYGAVALIVKADDAGVALARRGQPVLRALGRGLVHGMPALLRALSILGTAAMIWVGGGIIIHGLEGFGLTAPGHAIHILAERGSHALGVLTGLVQWLVTAAASGVFGLVLGTALIPTVQYAIAPLWRGVKRLMRRPSATA